eukprot:GILJ01010000.1.p1 GENE.GILJ01010000.1~~GILJ01010000.1.p1  ORF type:complete len:1364 (-),score=247.43 GILJ01010000.1:46-4137(-)
MPAPLRESQQTLTDSVPVPQAVVAEAAKNLKLLHQVDSQAPDLRELLMSEEGGGYILEPSVSPFKLLPSIPIPSTLMQQYANMQFKCNTGIFSEMQRVWVTIDNMLFLWNYQDNSPDAILQENFDQVIVAVASLRPKPNMFVQEIEFLLAVATTNKLYLASISLTPQLQLQKTHYILNLDGITVTSLLGTDTGRVFMSGDDGTLYEMEYKPTDSWFSGKCRKLTHSANPSMSIIQRLIPSFLHLSQTNTRIVDLVHDGSRQLLYTLRDNFDIEVWRIGEELSLQRLCLLTRPTLLRQCIRKLEAQRNAVSAGFGSEQRFELVQLLPLTRVDSLALFLCAVTSEGYRLYFELSGEQDLVLVHVRPPPPPSISIGSGRHEYRLFTRQISGSDLPKTLLAFQKQGMCLLIDSRTEDSDRLWALSRDYTYPSSQSTEQPADPPFIGNKRHGLFESVLDSTLPGQVLAIADDASALLFNSGVGSRSGVNQVHELASQVIENPRRFLLVTNMGVHPLVRVRPLDQLIGVFTQSSFESSLEVFANRYSAPETVAMCFLAVATNSEIESATKAIFYLAGEPYFSIPSRTDSVGGSAGSTSTDLQFSAKYKGMSLFCSRVLRPLWGQPLLSPATYQRQPQAQYILPTEQKLTLLRDRLRAFSFFADTHRNRILHNVPTQERLPKNLLKRLITSWNFRSKTQEAKRREDLFTLALIQIASSTADLFSILILIQQNFGKDQSKLFELLPKDVADTVGSLTLAELIHDGFSTRIGKSLCSAFVQQYTSAEQTSDRLYKVCEMLRTECPNLFSVGDVMSHKANELLNLAVTMSPEERESKLSECIALALSHVQHVNLGSFANLLKEVDQYERIVDVCLAKAKGLSSAEASDCYAVLLRCCEEALQRSTPTRTAIVQKCLSSKDEQFHFELYRWFIKNGLADDLIELSAPYLEKYLAMADRDTSLPTDTDMLWRLYVHQRRFAQACEILHGLATKRVDVTSESLPKLSKSSSTDSNQRESGSATQLSPSKKRDRSFIEPSASSKRSGKPSVEEMEKTVAKGVTLTLDRRIHYLTLAVDCAKRSEVRNGHLALEELQDLLAVAKVQLQIYNELTQRVVDQEVADLSVANQLLLRLHSRLYSVADLYNGYCVPLHLYESALAIYSVSGFTEADRIRDTWQSLFDWTIEHHKRINSESTDESNADARVDWCKILRQKLEAVGPLYFPSASLFPVDVITATLETYSFEYHKMHQIGYEQQNISWVWTAMHNVGVSYSALTELYHTVIDSPLFQAAAIQVHLLHSVSCLVETWVNRAIDQTTGPASESGQIDLRELIAKLPSVDDLLLRFKQNSAALQHPDAVRCEQDLNRVRELLKTLVLS